MRAVALAAAFIIAAINTQRNSFGPVLPLPFSAHNAQIWAASVSTGTEPAFVQIGGSGREVRPNVRHEA